MKCDCCGRATPINYGSTVAVLCGACMASEKGKTVLRDECAEVADDFRPIATDAKEDLSPSSRAVDEPGLTVLFYILSGLSFLGGVILASKFWPGDSGYGRELESVAYAWSIVWLSVGILEAAIFAAIGKALSLLQQIAKNTGT